MLVHRTTQRFAFECQIDTFARNESDLNRTRIEWECAFSNTPDVYEFQDRQNVFNPLPGYSILVVDIVDIPIDMFPDIYWCIAIFILQNGTEVIVATSEPGMLILAKGNIILLCAQSNFAFYLPLQLYLQATLVKHHLVKYHLVKYHLVEYHLVKYHLVKYHLVKYHLVIVVPVMTPVAYFYCHHLT